MSVSHAMKLRWFFVGALVLFVAVTGFSIYQRGDDVPKSARDLPYNHRIEAADLALRSIDPLLGQYLRIKVAKGTPIEAAMLSPAPLLPAVPTVGTAAAVLSVPIVEGQKLSTTYSSPLLASRHHRPRELRSIKVLRLSARSRLKRLLLSACRVRYADLMFASSLRSTNT